MLSYCQATVSFRNEKCMHHAVHCLSIIARFAFAQNCFQLTLTSSLVSWMMMFIWCLRLMALELSAMRNTNSFRKFLVSCNYCHAEIVKEYIFFKFIERK